MLAKVTIRSAYRIVPVHQVTARDVVGRSSVCGYSHAIWPQVHSEDIHSRCNRLDRKEAGVTATIRKILQKYHLLTQQRVLLN